MDGMQMLVGMGGIDSKYIEEAEEAERAQRVPWSRILSFAAAACLCVMTGVAWMKTGLFGKFDPKGIARQEKQEAYAQVANSAETQECQMESMESWMETASESGMETTWKETTENGVVKVWKETEESGMETAREETMEGGTEIAQKETTESGMEIVQKESTDISEEGAVSSELENAEMINGTKQAEGDVDETSENYRMISSYGVSHDNEMAAKTADYAVENGSCFLSDSLRAALDAYGEDFRYRVVVDIFSDGVQVPADGEVAAKETERLFAEGYIVAVETLSDGVNTQTLFTLHATAGQLIAFKGLYKYGYGIWLYGERTKTGL